jgi:hypothetical protein
MPKTKKDPTVTRWEKYAEEHLLNKKIVKVRYMLPQEQEATGFYRKALIMVLDDGSMIFPSADDEGNDAGALFGQDKDGSGLTFPVI